MPWTVTIPEQVAYVEATISGKLSVEDLFGSFDASLSAAQSSGRKLLLADLSNFGGGPSILDLMELAEKRHMDPERRFSRIAMVMPPIESAAKLVLFSETAFANQGMKSNSFAERSLAVAWLDSEWKALKIAAGE